VKPPKPKKCRCCPNTFIPRSSLQVVCGIECAKVHAERTRKRKEALSAKIDRKVTREKKEKLKSRSDHLREAQRVFNLWIRKRDEKEGCISCDKPATWQGQWHASHLHSVGSHPELRFNEDNVWKSCSVCNNHLSGNLLKFKDRLIAKIGIERVDALLGEYKPMKYTIDEIKAIKALYRQKLREMV
jgi:hypothetical protein